MTSIQSTTSIHLDESPSCLSFVPGESDIFVVGTYVLDSTEKEADGSQRRTGSLVLCRIDNDTIEILQTIKSPSGFLNIAFSPHDSKILCGATSTGSLSIHTFSQDPISLTHKDTIQCFSESTLVLDLQWHPIDRCIIGVSLSTGHIALCQIHDLQNKPTCSVIAVFQHDLEAWTLTFSTSGDVLSSGGDDAVLASRYIPTAIQHLNDVPSSERLDPADISWPGSSLPGGRDRRIHGAGVTAILPLPSLPASQSAGDSVKQSPGQEKDMLLLTGSYDDHVRLLHWQMPSHNFTGRAQPLVLAEADLGGGVWRLRLISSTRDEYVILACCMYVGARIVRVRRARGEDSKDDWTIEVLARFEEHKSMNYAAEIRPQNDSTQSRRTVLSTSFYDRLLCLWHFDV